MLDRDRHPVSGLTAADFILTEDGRAASDCVVHRVPRDAYDDLLPVVPTARRDFGASDRVSALVRVYQGGSHALVPATVITRIVDAKNEQMTKSTRELDPSLFKDRAFDHRFDLPRNLAAGEYLFTVEITAGGKTSERALRFRVR